MANFREVLRQELADRISHNSAYSLRAFARDIQIAPSRLSEILNGKQGLSRVAAEKIAMRMGFTKHEVANFCDLVDSQHARSNAKKSLARIRIEKLSRTDSERLTDNQFKVLSDWYHFAILELTQVSNFKSDKTWIAKKLGLSQLEVSMAVDRLFKLGLLKEKNGTWQRGKGLFSMPGGSPSEAIKKYHKQILEKSISALFTQTVDEREFSAMNFAMKKSRIPEAKEALKKFRREFCEEFERGSNKSDVYCLALQFFKLTGGES